MMKYSSVEQTLTMVDHEEANMREAKVKMEEVREENERLKLTLSQMMKDYRSLKMQFNGRKSTNMASMADESELVSLSLGRFSVDSRREDMKKNRLNKTKLGLKWKLVSDNSGSRNPSPSISDESKEEGRSNARSSRTRAEDEDNITPLKKPRVSVRAVCNTQTMHDGCQWRKYGQKISKGNPCPRAYYRCTVSSTCPVRKQVQRCIDDMSILVTTYEGTHNHPLPPSATTMASATSAAATMLSCGPSTSPSLFGFNSNTNNIPRATVSTSQSHPTVILDLTAPNHRNKFSSPLFSATHSTLNFSSFNPNTAKIPTVASSSYSHRPPLFSDIKTQAANDQKVAAAITHDPAFQSEE